ncbi:polyadenylate-binding protein-interacting protein 7 isoform X3 [Sorghum bicolor]|uniref:polyadenylate-binding protein-interacting protein 7 isoform X3 n=1 Tax=Sorghum bicolor TaxID=4558 RepID=UPI000B4262B5|nr:polyadenylate-binding protein-interacting protein 7 isoform X3 [Sorghum bicolor]|eukprot:XP_021304158.1 polyadenylate-binding protein-interacting protein 7 isoform X3 [Sorghum bicolor]
MSIEERKISMISKSTMLNPNAEEFVPSSLRSVNDSSKRSDATMVVSGPSKESSTDKPESILRSNSDEEAHQYWQQQLPDDITPDFKVLGQDESTGPDSLSLTGLSINDGIGTSIFSPNQALSMQHHASPFIRDKLSTRPKINLSGPTYMDERSQATILSPTAGSMSPNAAPWVKTMRNGVHYNTSRRDTSHYNGDSSIGASLHNLSDVYGSRRSLSSTMDIMSQLESKVDGRLGQNLRSLSFGNSSPPSPASYAQNGLGNYSNESFGLPNSPYRSHSAILADDIVSPSAGREHISLDVPRGRYKMTSLPVPGLGSSRGSQLLGGSYNGNHDMISTNTLQNMAGIQTGPAWLESDAAANAYLESKDEVHDFASLRHAVLEQVFQIQGEREREKDGIWVSPAPAAWRGSSVWTRCGMRTAPPWRGAAAAGISCGQHRPGLDLRSGSHLHRRHGGGPRYGTDAVCGWRQLGGELSASAADSVGLD